MPAAFKLNNAVISSSSVGESNRLKSVILLSSLLLLLDCLFIIVSSLFPMQSHIMSTPESAEYYFKEGCHILELSNSVADPTVSIARARVVSGVTTQWHYLIDTTERYVILQGQGCVELANTQSQTVQAGDVVIIPPFCWQRISNTGVQDLIFLAICSPRFLAENYVSA